ncbi:hypothetical protein VPH35_126489 [Triticum aestivum]
MNRPEMSNSHDEPEKLQDSNATPMCSLRDELEKKLQDSDATPMCLRLEFLRAITCDFSTESELGRGGYGVVYKGVLRSGKIIAVKKLFELHLKEENFQNEVSYLMGIKHRNIVQFVGYCAESHWEAIEKPSGSKKHIFAEVPKRLLCFEYVSNKGLDKHIYERSLDLKWNMRYEIIKGICNGLRFLHDECRIIHLDLKPENILMDSNMTPKIADFGLSRIFGEQQSHIVTDNHAGTRGYMAPEYLIHGVITKKADIFSLGIIIIEIITGQREYPYFDLDSSKNAATSCQHFKEKVLRSWRSKFVSTSKYISMKKYSQQVELCIAIALTCVDPAMEKRPTAKDIVQVLNAADQMEACGGLPIEMQCKDKSLILDTTVSKEHSIIEDVFSNETDGQMCGVKQSQEGLSPTTPLWESNIRTQNHQEVVNESSKPEQASDKTSEIEAHENLPSDMQYTEKLLVLNTSASKDLTILSVTEDMCNSEIDGKVVDKTASEGFSPTPLLELRTESPNYQEEMKAASEPQLASDTTSAVEAREEFPLYTASKDLAPHSVTEENVMNKTDGKLVDEGKTACHTVTEDNVINKTDGKLVAEANSDEDLSDLPWGRAGVAAPGLRRRIKVHPLPSHEQAQQAQASPPPAASVFLRESSIGNQNDLGGAKDSSVSQSAHDTTTETEVITGSSALPDVCPLELHFRFEPDKLIPCSLEITNNTDENLLLVLMKKGNDQSCFLCLPLYGIVAPRSTYTLVVTMNKHKNLPKERTIDLILQSSIIGYDSLCTDAKYICEEHFKEAEETGTTVHKVSLKAVCALQAEMPFEAMPPLIKIISVENTDSIHSMDANQTDPLILTGSFGYVHMHNYGLQKSVGSVEASRSQIVCVKFIARKRWFVAGSSDGFVHVYKYENKMENIMSFEAHSLGVCSLAVHPTKPYVLSGSRAQIKLWDWDQHWSLKCIQTSEEHWGYVCGVAFNPEDTNSFASFTDGSEDHAIQVWSIDSPECKFTLSGHSRNVRCLDFFTRDGRKCLVTGSLDKTAKIWDMQKNACTGTLPHRSAVLSVVSHPNLPILVTGTEDGHVYLWCSINFRLKRILNIHGRERVEGLACLAGSRRVAVAHNDALSVMEIGDEEHGGGEGKSEDSVSAADWEILLDTNVKSMHARKKEKAKKC